MNMKVRSKILLLSLGLGLSILLACKKNETINEPEPEGPIVVIPPDSEVPERKLIPTQLKSGQTTITFSYNGDHKLLAINYDQKTSTEISYSAQGKLNGIIYYKNDEMTGVTQLSFNKDGLCVQADHILINDDAYVPTGYYKLGYNNAQQVVSISYFNEFNKPVNQQQRNYSATGNLDYDTWNLPDFNIKYSYDDKNGIFKNVNMALILALEKENPLFDCILNNKLQSTNSLYPDNNQLFSYTYNKDKYPETITSTLNGKVSTTKVTYEAIP
jgi:hypothetical protein